ncbi:hypothetical protein ykris0001_33930 [Yersinia kristensenii ATCC 33638]|nr:hypothetical protein ykris0001_20340 [Yersinia kristensenii ATCC 33638]EEP93269.1 hypothetical protein ykris0001_33930 [Yersinia kristensenii ATCC 33638]
MKLFDQFQAVIWLSALLRFKFSISWSFIENKLFLNDCSNDSNLVFNAIK